MATSLFFMPTDQNSGEIQPVQKTRGRKPGSKTAQQNQIKKQRRGMGVAKLERLRTEAEKRQMSGAGGDSSSASDVTRLPVSLPDPGVVLQGFPSYATPPTTSSKFNNRRFYCGGGGVGSGQIMIDPVWGFVETSTELSSIPNPQIHHHHAACDTCFKKKRFDDGDHQSVVRSNGTSGFTKYMIPPMAMNGYDHLLPPDQRSYGYFYNDVHRIARSDVSSASTNNDATNLTGSMIEEFGGNMEGNPRNGVKEYEFFPGKYDNFPGIYGIRVPSSPINNNTSTIDLSLKL